MTREDLHQHMKWIKEELASTKRTVEQLQSDSNKVALLSSSVDGAIVRMEKILDIDRADGGLES